MKCLIALVLVVLLLVPLVSQAQSRSCYKSCYSRRCYDRCGYRRGYDRTWRCGNPGTKLASGVSEVATSWVQIPSSIARNSKCNPIAGVIYGTAEGTVLAVRDCIEGAVNTALFWAPPYDSRETRFMPRGRCEPRKKGIWETIKDWDESFKENWW